MLNVGNFGCYVIYPLVIPWFVCMYDVIMRERERVHYRTGMRRISDYHIFMHTDQFYGYFKMFRNRTGPNLIPNLAQ